MPVPYEKPIFVVPLELGTITGPAAAGSPASHLGRLKAPGLTWRNSGGGTVSGTLPSSQSIDFAALISTNAAPSTTLRVQAGGHDSGVQPLISPAITRGDGLYNSFYEFPAPVDATSWSITVAHSGMFEAAILVLGRKLQPKKFYDFGFEFGGEDTGTAEITKSGVWDEDEGMILRTLSMTLNWQSEEEWEEMFRPMIEKVGTTQPIYLAFDPAPSKYRQNRTYYGHFQKMPFATGRRKPRTFGGEYNMLSVI